MSEQQPGVAMSEQQPQIPMSRPTNAMAVVSLIMGVGGVSFLPVLGSILALVFGYIARGQIDRSQGAEEGRGFATAGIVLGWIGVVLTVLVIVLVIVAIVFAVNVGFNGGEVIEVEALTALR